MALGTTAIKSARDVLVKINENCKETMENNEELEKILKDSNYLTFVSQTTSGDRINEQLSGIVKWTNKLTESITTLRNITERYLDEQENLNK